MPEILRDIEADFYSFLLSISAITAQISNRLYPTLAPSNATFPYVTYNVIGTVNNHSLSRMSKIDFTSIQVDIWGNTSLSCRTVHNVIRGNIDHYRGVMGSSFVRSIIMSNAFSGNAELLTGSEEGSRRIISTYDIAYDVR